MFDIMYEQTYTIQWKYLAAMLDMFNSNTDYTPDEALIEEMIDKEYLVYDEQEQTIRLPANYHILVDSFFQTKAATNIEAPKVAAMGCTLSLYYLNNHRHMLVLMHVNDETGADGVLEVAISSKSSSPTKTLEQLGCDICDENSAVVAQCFDPQNLPVQYKTSYDQAVNNNSLFRVTLMMPNDDTDDSDDTFAAFAAFPCQGGGVWMNAANQILSESDKPIVVQKLSKQDYMRQLTLFFDLLEKQIYQ